MPELPDVATFRDRLEREAGGRRIERTSVRDERVLEGVSAETLARRLKGARIDETRRHGKYLFVRAGEAPWLVMHFGMTGDIVVTDGDEPEHARVVFELDDDRSLFYVSQRMLGRIEVTDDVDGYVDDQDLGPDAMDDDLDADAFVARFEERSGMVKSALTDQGLIAGIGNVYADEILFQAGIHPQRELDDLDADDLRELHRTMRRVLRVTTEHQARPEDFPRGYLTPRRGDESAECPRCDGSLETTEVSGRTTWFCPACQS